MKDSFPTFIWKKTTEHIMTSHNISQEKVAIKMPLAHKTMPTVLWGAKECILVSFLPQGKAEMLLVNFRLSRNFVMLTLMFREACCSVVHGEDLVKWLEISAPSIL
jgi:hypothetical protein